MKTNKSPLIYFRYNDGLQTSDLSRNNVFVTRLDKILSFVLKSVDKSSNCKNLQYKTGGHARYMIEQIDINAAQILTFKGLPHIYICIYPCYLC